MGLLIPLSIHLVQGRCQASGVLGQETSPLGQSLEGGSTVVGGTLEAKSPTSFVLSEC